MKRKILNLSSSPKSGDLQKVILLVILCFALVIGSVSVTDAQRHEGRGGGHRDPAWHYSRMPARGAFINRLPYASSRINYGGNYYHFNNGLFYRPSRGGFVVAAPPFGLRIGILPRGFLSFTIGGLPYYYYCGTYYIHRGGEYEVVAPPLGAVVESLPPGYDKLTIRGETYYIADGVQYRPILRNGEIWYEVTKSPNR